MKRSHYMIVAMLICGVALTWGMALSSERTHEEGKELLTTKLSMVEAIAIAKKQFPGQVLEAELEREHDQVVYEIEISSTTGVVTEVKVDAQSGELLSSKIEDDDDHEHEKSKEKNDD